MKKIIITGAAMLGFVFTSNQLSAQESFMSGGTEIAISLGDYGDVYPFGFGVSGQYEFGVTSKLGITASAGYTLMTPDSELNLENAYFLPLQVGGKYYLTESREGLFLAAQLGVHIFGGGGSSETATNLSFAPEVGYFFTEKISAALRFNVITQEEGVDNWNYLGLRAAYNF